MCSDFQSPIPKSMIRTTSNQLICCMHAKEEDNNFISNKNWQSVQKLGRKTSVNHVRQKSMTRVHSAHRVLHRMSWLQTCLTQIASTDDTRLSVVHCRQFLFGTRSICPCMLLSVCDDQVDNRRHYRGLCNSGTTLNALGANLITSYVDTQMFSTDDGV